MSGEPEPIRLPRGMAVKGELREKVTAYVVARYRKGASVRVIADEIGRSYGFVHKLLTEAHQARRSQGGYRRRS